jgi:hypothetical protein
VNEVSARLVAGAAALMAVVTIALDQHWILALMAYGFVARVLTGPTLSPLGQIVTRMITPRLGVAPKYVPGPPKRFAQGMGAVMTTLAAVLALGFGLDLAADVMLGMLIAAATLEAVFAVCLGCIVFGWLMRAGIIPQRVCERCSDLWGERTGAAAAERPPAGRLPALALALVGVGLIIAPIGFRMFDRAPRGAAMMTAFRPYMTEARLAGFQGDIRDIDAAVAESATSAARYLARAGDPAGPRGVVAFRAEWAPIDADMSGLLDRIEANLGNYRAVASLPRFTVFPWLFVVPGALLVLLGAAAAFRPSWWTVIRWALVAVGIGLVALPLALRMFERGPAGARMMDAFRTVETRQRVEATQGHFGAMAVGEGAIRLELLPALRRTGLSDRQIALRFPAISRLERRWVPILGDMTPMIGAMSDNVDDYAALTALPSFALFPWFFVLPGLVSTGVALAARPRRGRAAGAAAAAVARTRPSER